MPVEQTHNGRTSKSDIRNALNTTKSSSKGQGDANTHAVGAYSLLAVVAADCISGLDNAGKTTIVKKIMNEDVNSVSPTLGFIIKTIEYDGYECQLQDLTRG
jgi:hypothetical protein